jgi:hypothetical protein
VTLFFSKKLSFRKKTRKIATTIGFKKIKNYKKQKNMKNNIYLFMLLVSVALLQSCAIYDKHEMPQYRIGELKDPENRFYIIQEKEDYAKVWSLEFPAVKKSEIVGIPLLLTRSEAANIIKTKKNNSGRKSKHNVLLYVNDVNFVGDTLTRLDYSEVQKAEVYEINQGKSVLISSMSVFGGPFAAGTFIAIIALIIGLAF